MIDLQAINGKVGFVAWASGMSSCSQPSYFGVRYAHGRWIDADSRQGVLLEFDYTESGCEEPDLPFN
jgi:hypothetical protein